MSEARIVTPKLTLRRSHEDTGLCRMYYKEVATGIRYPRLFCIQVNPVGEPIMMVCSRDGEPSHAVGNFEIVSN